MDAWKLIRSKDTPVGEGLEYAQNVRVATVGECQRRLGMTNVSTASGAMAIGPFFFPSEGFGALLVTSAGAIVKVSL
jgi:hypothetical protein